MGRTVADLAVATDAVLMIICMFKESDRFGNQRSVAAEAVLLQNLAIGGANFDRLVKILESEFTGVIEAVLGFDHVPARKRSGQVAIVADRHAVMTSLLPTVKLLAHDVAVDTDIGIV